MSNWKTVEESLKNTKQFRVSVFGSARTNPGDHEYDMAYLLGYELGKREIGVVTGGGPGQMDAANKGHVDSLTHDSPSIGLTIELPWEGEGNSHMDLQKHFQHFGKRLDNFMALSNAVVITAGGIGTCLELFYTLQLTQVKHICPIPIILLDPMWHDLKKWLKGSPISRKFVSPGDLDNVICASTIDEALAIIDKTKKEFDKGGDDVCINSQIYKVEEELATA